MAKKRNKGRQPFELPTYLSHLPKKINMLKGGEILLKGTVEVTDLFKGAFLLCMGGRLEQVRVRNNGRRIATFMITGTDLQRFDSDYRSGRALVDPVRLREALNHLRDVMFEKLRNHEGRKINGYRKRDHRAHQAHS
ncbi:MAG: hypothetical protein PVG41_05040 [Desulfobacteraceae bacterium]|jgi:hypothetical protein